MNIFKKIFGLNKAKETATPTKPIELEKNHDTKSENLEVMLVNEIKKSPFIKESCKASLINDFNLLSNTSDRGTINFGDDFLSLDEKKALNLNPRIKVPKKVINVLTDEGLMFEDNPKDVISNISRSASNKVKLNKELSRMRKLNIQEMRIKNVGDARDCDWCHSMNGKFLPTTIDYVALINENCKCEYYRGLLSAKIVF